MHGGEGREQVMRMVQKVQVSLLASYAPCFFLFGTRHGTGSCPSRTGPLHAATILL